ncbi:hypothetical protein [Methylobacterium dankookense]|uniref:Uncharacterized protein n=1 Tax=Methylobacterium dankookense TaxID=560405 RepID=A0A564G5J9_9HYPH|nr:hypothetical protein [Methylobacterium dankookense]VUF15825.1 hypothetical protein MTDSW087_05573 [Methylobacterium dankookense]
MRGITDAEEQRDVGRAGGPSLRAARLPALLPVFLPVLLPALLAAAPARAQLRPSDAGSGGLRYAGPADGAADEAAGLGLGLGRARPPPGPSLFHI